MQGHWNEDIGMSQGCPPRAMHLRCKHIETIRVTSMFEAQNQGPRSIIIPKGGPRRIISRTPGQTGRTEEVKRAQPTHLMLKGETARHTTRVINEIEIREDSRIIRRRQDNIDELSQPNPTGIYQL